MAALSALGWVLRLMSAVSTAFWMFRKSQYMVYSAEGPTTQLLKGTLAQSAPNCAAPGTSLALVRMV